MGDPISFTASLLAIASAAGVALGVSVSLYDFARAVQAASDDIEDFALDIRAFGSIIQLGHDSLKRYCSRGIASPVLKYLDELELVEQLAAQSKRTKKHINRTWNKTKSIESDFDVITRMKWYFRRADVLALRPEMEALKTSLILITNYIAIEAATHREDTKETREEMYVSKDPRRHRMTAKDSGRASLKRQIQVQIKTIALLQQSQARRMAQSESTGVRNMNMQSALVYLGEKIVRDGRAPDPKSFTPSSSTHSLGRNIPRSPEYFYASPPVDIRPVSDFGVHSEGHESTPAGEVATQPFLQTSFQRSKRRHVVTVSVLQSPQDEHREPELRQERRSISDRHGSDGSNSNPSSPNNHVSGNIPQPTTVSQVERQFPFPNYTSKFLHLEPLYRLRKIQGAIRINTNSEDAPVIARLQPKLPGNLISSSLSRKLGLSIELKDIDQSSLLEIASGDITRCQGVVKFTWIQDNLILTGIRCLVYEYDDMGLVFGDQFLERERDFCENFHANYAKETTEGHWLSSYSDQTKNGSS